VKTQNFHNTKSSISATHQQDEQIGRCAAEMLARLAAAGPNGLSKGGLELPSPSARAGTPYHQALKRLEKEGRIGNLGSPQKPRYVTAEHFRPLEIAYEQIAARAKEAGVRLSSNSGLTRGLRGAAVKKKADEALKLLVQEGVLLRLKWAGNPLYLHTSALPGPAHAGGPAAQKPVDREAIRRAYDETVRHFGYADVLILELHRRLGGDLESLKQALLADCRTGEAIPGVGDWSLSSEQERAAALYINGHPHLRIRLKG
jgi:hypothetical protein